MPPAKRSFKEQVFGAEDNSAAKMDQEKLGRFQQIAARMYHTPQLSAKEIGMPVLARIGRQISDQVGVYKNYFFVSVLRIDMVYVVLINTLIGIYDLLNNPLMGIAYDRTRTRWGKARPYAFLMPLFYFGSTTLLYCGGLFFQNNNNTTDPRKILFVFSMLFIQETFSTIFNIPNDNFLSLMSPNPRDRMSIGLWQEYSKRWSGDFISFLIVPFLDAARSGIGSISPGMVFAAFGAISLFTGTAGSMAMAAKCRERLMLQPKPAATTKTLFYILKNKYALRNFVADFVTSWWSNGGYSWDVVSQLEIFGGFFRFTPLSMGKHVASIVSLALVEPFKKMFGGSYKRTVIFMRTWDTLANSIVAILGLFPKVIGTWWKLGLIYMAGDFLNTLNDAPSSVLENEINREINDYTEYMTGERPDGTFGLLTGLVSKVIEPLRTLMAIAMIKWIGYDPNIGGNKRWTQEIVRENSTMYSKIFFVWKFGNILSFFAKLVPLIMYDIEGKKREDMYIALNERRALVAKESAMPDGMETLTEMLAQVNA